MKNGPRSAEYGRHACWCSISHYQWLLVTLLYIDTYFVDLFYLLYILDLFICVLPRYLRQLSFAIDFNMCWRFREPIHFEKLSVHAHPKFIVLITENSIYKLNVGYLLPLSGIYPRFWYAMVVNSDSRLRRISSQYIHI